MSLIDVIMPVFNGEKYLSQAINSILSQTYTKFTLYLINDCSNDGSYRVMKSFKDERIVLIDNETKLGISGSINKVIKFSKGEFIARMDCDDIADNRRLELQLEFLKKNKEYGMVGSSYYRLSPSGFKIGTKSFHPLIHNDIVWKMFFKNAFTHPSVMIRKSSLVENNLEYDESFSTSQDYELWSRFIVKSKSANIAQPLLKLRIHNNSVSSKFGELQANNSAAISYRYISRLFPEESFGFDEIKEISFKINYQNQKIRKSNDMTSVKVYKSLYESFKLKYPESDSKFVRREYSTNILQILSYNYISILKMRWLLYIFKNYPLSFFFFVTQNYINFIKRIIKLFLTRN